MFCIQSGKFYTEQNLFTQAPPVVPVTNMRYVNMFHIAYNKCYIFKNPNQASQGEVPTGEG